MTRLWMSFAAYLTLTLGAAVCARDVSDLKETLGEDSAGIEAIALYPEAVRNAILEASTHPELIVKVAALQGRSSEVFEEMLSGYSQENQEAIWDLTRFPGLIDRLVEGDIKRKSEIRQILEGYPAEIHEAALTYGRTEYDLLADIHELNRSTGAQFEALLESYSGGTGESYRILLRHPEILAILNEDMNLTVLLGDTYQNDPEAVKVLAAELNLKVASEHAAKLSEQAETTIVPLVSSSVAQEYHQKYTYDDSGFDEPDDGGAEIAVSYYGTPYPYWFGYPRWYVTPHVHTSLAWYITPRVRASVSLFPSTLYFGYSAPVRHHLVTWSKYRHRPPVRVVVRKPSRRTSKR